MSEDEKKTKTYIKMLSFCSFADPSNPAAIDVSNGKIIRTRPLHYDWKYDPKKIRRWKIKRGGKTFEPGLKSLLPPFSLAYHKRAYSLNRVMYPLKRVDWNPDGDRNPQNRGESKYERISWNEALNIIVSEIKRIQEEYAPEAIFAQGDGQFDLGGSPSWGVGPAVVVGGGPFRCSFVADWIPGLDLAAAGRE